MGEIAEQVSDVADATERVADQVEMAPQQLGLEDVEHGAQYGRPSCQNGCPSCRSRAGDGQHRGPAIAAEGRLKSVTSCDFYTYLSINLFVVVLLLHHLYY